jgi:hypothetical protein
MTAVLIADDESTAHGRWSREMKVLIVART